MRCSFLPSVVAFSAVLFGIDLARAFELPDWVYRIERLDEARSAAKRSRKALTFILTNEHTR